MESEQSAYREGIWNNLKKKMIDNVDLFPILRKEPNSKLLNGLIEFDLGIRDAFNNHYDNLNRYWYVYSNEMRDDLPRIIILATLIPYFDKYPTREVKEKIHKLFNK